MHKLPQVEEAKSLLNEAKDWSVWRWLTDKKRVRTAADLAWEALDEAEEKIVASWPDDLRKAWREREALSATNGDAPSKRQRDKAKAEAAAVDPKIKATAERLKQADLEAYEARALAENTFVEAERRMSASLAREGSRQAVEAWEIRESLMRKFEAAGRKKPADLAAG
jgi:hypothetical protein